MSFGDKKGHDDAPGHFSLRDVLTIVFKRRMLIIVFAISVFTAIMTVSILRPRIYEVSSTLLVNKARAEVPIAPTETTNIIDWVNESDINSELEILKSRSLLEDVVDSLYSTKNLVTENNRSDRAIRTFRKLLGGQRLSPTDSLVVELQKKLVTVSIRRANAIRISFRSTDPEWATQVVGTVTNKYLERRVEAFQSPQTVAFFEEQMLETEQRLREYERAIQHLVEDSSITVMKGQQGSDSLAAQKSLAMSRLSQLESALGDAEVQMQEQIYEVASLSAILEEEPERLPTASRNNITAATEEIEVALATLRLRRDELLQDFKPDSRHVRDVETQIEMATQRLQMANEESVGINRTEINPIHQQIKGGLMRAEADLDGTRARVSLLRIQVAENRETLDDLNVIAFELDALTRQALAAEDDYLLYRKKHEEARISAAMDREKFLNVTVVQPAQIPLKPLPRGLAVKFLMALAAGVVGGLLLVFGLETYLDRSFTTGEEIERKLVIPHIASIPESEMVG